MCVPDTAHQKPIFNPGVAAHAIQKPHAAIYSFHNVGLLYLLISRYTIWLEI